MNIKKDYIKCKGADIYFETKGEGKSILFIHAGIADCRMWENEFNLMSQYFHVIRFDLPGFGLSNFTGGSFSFSDIINDLLDHLGVNRVHIVAASFGAKIALDYISNEPQKCLNSVLVSPALSGWNESQYLVDYEVEEERLYECGKLNEVCDHNIKMWILRDRTNTCISEELRQLLMDMQMKSLSKPEPDVEPEEIEEEEQIGRLDSIETPLVVITGSEDVPDFLNMSNLLCEKIQGSKRVIVENTAHLPNLESPEEFKRILLESFTQ